METYSGVETPAHVYMCS